MKILTIKTNSNIGIDKLFKLMFAKKSGCYIDLNN